MQSWQERVHDESSLTARIWRPLRGSKGTTPRRPAGGAGGAPCLLTLLSVQPVGQLSHAPLEPVGSDRGATLARSARTLRPTQRGRGVLLSPAAPLVTGIQRGQGRYSGIGVGCAKPVPANPTVPRLALTLPRAEKPPTMR